MVILYVVSTEEGTGKTMVCTGLGKYLQSNGKKVGFLKTLVSDNADGDAAFMKRVLDLPEAVESLCLPASDIKRIKEACDKVSQGRDVIIVEGMLRRSAGEIANTLSARVIAVEAYSGQASKFIDSYKEFKGNLLGVVLNKVPASQLKRVRDEVSAQLGSAGLNFLGVLPEDRALFAITVGELAESIHGKILNNEDKSAELVENFMLGAMVVDSGLDYFGRKSHKAAVVRHDRPDMQLAALETSTRCLILSGSKESPVYNVFDKAKNRSIPIISTERATSDVIASIEEALSKARFNQEQKLPKLTDVVKQHLNLKALL